MRKVLVTGATGFVGQALLTTLVCSRDLTVIAAVRCRVDSLAECVIQVDGTDVGPDTDWSEALRGVTHVIHLAGVAAGTGADSADSALFQRVNTDGTLNLAQQAGGAGVLRFIFISSVHVNGNLSSKPFNAADKPAPFSSYAQSKFLAELGLKSLSKSKDLSMEVVIIRPPLVYGPHVAGKFAQLLAALESGWYLPLGAIHNRRSMVAVGNLVDLIETCIDHPAAANQTFLVSDGEDLSTTELLRRMGRALGKPARLLPIPAGILTGAAALLGRRSMAQSLCGDLQVDISHTCTTLDWQPPLSVDEALKQTAEAFLATAKPSGQAARSTGTGNGVLRLCDILFSALGLVIGSPILLLLLVAGYFDTGSPLFRQQRVGRNQKPFTLVKFRTMRPDTASVATHLADASAITRFGKFLRRTKLDELPQLWNVLKGEMSLVGPRPGLSSQTELTAQRQRLGVFSARPGITGLAQVNNIDMSTPKLLAETDRRMLDTLSMTNYFKYIFMTVTGRGSGDPAGKG